MTRKPILTGRINFETMQILKFMTLHSLKMLLEQIEGFCLLPVAPLLFVQPLNHK